jgi:glycosyltransferase involved in cell wall biosynthesis
MSDALRFCLVTTFYPPYHFGGDAAFVHALARALAARGHAVDVVHSVDAYRLAARETRPGYTETPGVRRLPLETAVPHLSALMAHQTGTPGPYRRRLREILEGGGYDVVHFHNVSLIGGPGVFHYGNAVKLYTAHEYWLVCPMHVLFAFDREACRTKRCVRCTLHARRPPQLWRATRHIDRSVEQLDRMLMPSRFAMQRYAADGVAARMELLPNFVRAPAQASVPAASREPTFLFVGRLEKLKGLQDLFPMLRRFAHLRLRVAGTGTYEAELRRQSADLRNVEFLGHVHPSKLPALYAEATAVVVPSLCYEVFPLAVVEALAHGVPVIGRRIGALAEVVEESGGGLLFDSTPECGELMQRLVDEPGLRTALAARGRAATLERWTEDVHLGRYLALVRGLIEARA